MFRHRRFLPFERGERSWTLAAELCLLGRLTMKVERWWLELSVRRSRWLFLGSWRNRCSRTFDRGRILRRRWSRILLLVRRLLRGYRKKQWALVEAPKQNKVRLGQAYQVHVFIFGLFFKLGRPHPVLQEPPSKQKPPNPQSVAAITEVGQNPQRPLSVSTRQLKPFGAIRGLEISPSIYPHVEKSVVARWWRIGEGAPVTLTGAGVVAKPRHILGRPGIITKSRRITPVVGEVIGVN